MTDVNYGFTLTKNAVSLGEITKISLPEVAQGAVEKTHHGTPDWREWIPDGLLGVAEFDVTVSLDATLVATIVDSMVAKTVDAWVIGYPGTDVKDWTFNAFPTKLQVGDGEAGSPGLLECVISVQPTGVMGYTT